MLLENHKGNPLILAKKSRRLVASQYSAKKIHTKDLTDALLTLQRFGG